MLSRAGTSTWCSPDLSTWYTNSLLYTPSLTLLQYWLLPHTHSWHTWTLWLHSTKEITNQLINLTENSKCCCTSIVLYQACFWPTEHSWNCTSCDMLRFRKDWDWYTSISKETAVQISKRSARIHIWEVRTCEFLALYLKKVLQRSLIVSG